MHSKEALKATKSTFNADVTVTSVTESWAILNQTVCNWGAWVSTRSRQKNQKHKRGAHGKANAMTSAWGMPCGRLRADNVRVCRFLRLPFSVSCADNEDNVNAQQHA